MSETGKTDDELRTRIEAVLFATDQPVSSRRIAEVLGVTDGQVREQVAVLFAQYQESGRAFTVEEIAGGFQILTRAEYGETVKQLFSVDRQHKLSQAALETLAIIAYKQPIHRADIEAIRGVAVDSILRTLQERALIRIVGRADVLGRPFLYGTTKRFLEAFGLKSLDDLPSVEELHIP